MRGKGNRAGGHHNHIDLQLRKLRQQRGKRLAIAIGKTPFDRKVLALDIAEFAHAARETAKHMGIDGCRAALESQEANAPTLARLLRLRAPWRIERSSAECDHQFAAIVHA